MTILPSKSVPTCRSQDPLKIYQFFILGIESVRVYDLRS